MTGRLAILGGCGGIGRQLVTDAQAAGWDVLIYDLPQSIAAHPPQAEARALDASDAEAVAAAAADLSGPLGGFVNLCGFVTENEPILERDPEDWDSVIAGNLSAAFYAARSFAFQIAPGGAVVQIGSGLGHFARPGYGPYAIAKAGIAALTRQMALELAPDIRVNTVAPSAVDTAFLRGGTGRSSEDAPLRLDLNAYEANIPMRRVAVPSDVTGPILFLLSDQARYITGQTLHVNGGAFMP